LIKNWPGFLEKIRKSTPILKQFQKSPTCVGMFLEFLKQRWNGYFGERPHSGKYCFGKTPWQTWTQSLHLTKNKMLETHFQKDVSLHPTGEAETGSGGDQPARNNLSDRNGQGGIKSPQFPLSIPRENALENSLP
jgi:hypothetical protein